MYIPNIVFMVKTGRVTRGRDVTLVKGQKRLDFRKIILFSGGPEMIGINCQLIVCILSRKGRIHLDSCMWTLDKPTATLCAAI